VSARGRRRARQNGFTLLELVIALAIVGVLLVIAFGGLRVAIGAWTRGEDRAESQGHTRGLTQVIGRAVGAAYPYRGALGEGVGEQRLLFTGSEGQLELVTTAAPFPSGVPAAFTAVVIAIEEDPQFGRGLVVRQRVLPNREPFSKADVVFRDPTVQGLEIRYLAEQIDWVSAWDAEAEQRLPSAVAIRFSVSRGGKSAPLPPVTVSLRTGTTKP
jgi:prepilin-type N-terminal cleavage/methylation domain-containing protein